MVLQFTMSGSHVHSEMQHQGSYRPFTMLLYMLPMMCLQAVVVQCFIQQAHSCHNAHALWVSSRCQKVAYAIWL